MFTAEKPLRLVKNINEGVSQKSGKPYRMITVANLETLENYTLSCDPFFQLANLKKGDDVLLKIELENMFNNTIVRVIDIIPV